MASYTRLSAGERLKEKYRLTFVLILVSQLCMTTSNKDRTMPFAKDMYHSFDGTVEHLNRNQPVQKRNVVLLTGALPAIVISATSTGLMLSCRQFASSLVNNIDEIKFLRDRLSDMRSQINLQWNKVTSLLRNMQLLNSSLSVLEEQITFLYTLEEDLIVLLDPNIYDKLNAKEKALEEEVKKHNKTIAIAPNVLRASIKDKSDVLFRSIAQIAIYTGVYSYLARALRPRFEKITNKKMMKWMKSKPNIFGSKVHQIQNMKLKGASYQKYLANSNKWKNAYAKTIYQKKYQKVVKNYKLARLRGMIFINAVILAIEMVALVKHIQRCKEKDRKVKYVRKKLEIAEKEMMQTQKNISLLQLESYKAFGVLAERLQDSYFYNFVNHAYKLAKDMKIADTREARKKIKKFKLEMRTYDFKLFDFDAKDVVASVNSLVDGVKILNKNFKCEKKRIQLLIKSDNLCRKGTNKNAIWKLFQKDTIALHKVCKFEKSKKITKNQLQKIISNVMKLSNKSEICIRNNPIIREIVCKHLKNGLSDTQILLKMKDLTKEDIKFMKNSCHGDATNVGKTICIEKALGKTFEEAKKMFKDHKIDDLVAIYKKCNLTDFQKKFICESKNSGKGVSYVFKALSSYPKYIIVEAFSKCKEKISLSKIAYVCILSKKFKVKSPNHIRLKKLKDKYGYDVIMNLIQNRCKHFF